MTRLCLRIAHYAFIVDINDSAGGNGAPMFHQRLVSQHIATYVMEIVTIGATHAEQCLIKCIAIIHWMTTQMDDSRLGQGFQDQAEIEIVGRSLVDKI